ncbi:MAG: putative NAD-dependent ligase [Planctomycetota bacterium]
MSEHSSYRKFMGKAEFEKGVNSLLGIFEGIAIDGKINKDELAFFQMWLNDNKVRVNQHPFNELVPVIKRAIEDGFLTELEREEITWLCKKLLASDYFDTVTAGIQKLHGIVAGIASDGTVTVTELDGLANWLLENQHLKQCWPYDEIDSLVTMVLADKKIDSHEHEALMAFFTEFVSILDNKTIINPVLLKDKHISGVCAMCPELDFEESVFCLTGTSHTYPRQKFTEVIKNLGGKVADDISKKVDYLIVGANGNPTWAYACYGRKVEKAVELRKSGHSILIVHENDFHDAVSDL